jgi:serine/threonine-protein kinase
LLSERYELGERIGSGGMADVYLAVDHVLGRNVALKVLNTARAGDAAFHERFRREARAAARLNHPNIVAIYDWGAPEAASAANDRSQFDHFIVMEYVAGGNLSDTLARRGSLPEAEALGIAAQIAAALEAAHRQGVIHRDIKPQNVLQTSQGHVKVADFGIARAIGLEPVTRTAEVLGSAEYLSPEQAQGKPVDARSDLYSLGVVLYQLLTGSAPFNGDTPVAVAVRHVRELPEPPRRRNPAISAFAEAIVLKLLAKDPAQRFQSAAELRAALLAAQDRIAGAAAGTRQAAIPMTLPGPLPERPRPGRVVRPTHSPGAPAPARVRRSRPSALPWALVALALVVLLGAAVGITRLGGAGATAPPAGGMGPASAVVASSPATTAETSASGVATPDASLAAPPGPAATATALPATATPVPATASPVPATAAPTTRVSATIAAPIAVAADTAIPPTAIPTAATVPATAASIVNGTLDPAQTVVQFYTLVGEHRFGQAAQLWSPAMRAAYPPVGNIDGRFAAVQQMIVRQATQTSSAAGRATVAVDVVEIDAGSPPVTREYVGAWQLVGGPAGWLLDQPNLRQVR